MSWIVDCAGFTPEELASRMFFLAWKACGGTTGLGYLQDRPDAFENDVFKNVVMQGDYYPIERRTMFGDLHAEYVFGRMMKLTIRIKEDSVQILNDKFFINYNGFYSTYPTPQDLAKAAVDSLTET